MTLELPKLPPKCGDHAHCNGFGRPIDPATGLAFNCCEYKGDGQESPPECFNCGAPFLFIPHLGWQRQCDDRCSPNLSVPICPFCNRSLEEHRNQLLPSCHQRKSFNLMSTSP